MKLLSAPRPVAALETEQPNLPAESIALAPENTLDRASTATPAPYEIPERSNDRYYTDHWGINE
jgi:hypothetical protein